MCNNIYSCSLLSLDRSLSHQMGKQQNDHSFNHNDHDYCHGRLKAMTKRKVPIKIRYISNPVMIKASNASEFREIVQKLTGQDGPRSFKTISSSNTISITTNNKLKYVKETDLDYEVTSTNYAKMDISPDIYPANNMLLNSSSTSSPAGFEFDESNSFWGDVLLSEIFSGLINDSVFYDKLVEEF